MYIYIHTHTHIYIYIDICLFIYMDNESKTILRRISYVYLVYDLFSRYITSDMRKGTLFI